MAHFAELDENNIVKRVIVVANGVIANNDGSDNEQRGIEYLQRIFGGSTLWKQTSYNATFRKNYAGVTMKYDGERDAFINPDPPYPSWVFDEATCRWESPIPYPDNSEDLICYRWDEPSTSWKEKDV